MGDKTKTEWKLVGHSHAIADTGDYDGCYEITNGKISIFTKDDNDETLEPVVKALNESDSEFYLDDSVNFENHLLKQENEELKIEVKDLRDKFDYLISKK